MEAIKEEDVKKIGKDIAEKPNVESIKLVVMFRSGVTVTYSSYDDEDVKERKMKELEKRFKKK
ncbi:MAG: hypothetical protein ABIN05_07945 [candidate division WOR-3 bacterium]